MTKQTISKNCSSRERRLRGAGPAILAAGLSMVLAALPAIYFAAGSLRGLAVLVTVLILESALCLLMLVARVRLRAAEKEEHRVSAIVAAIRNGTIGLL